MAQTPFSSDRPLSVHHWPVHSAMHPPTPLSRAWRRSPCTPGSMDAQRQGGAEVDERFEFDAPRFYDFNTMTSDCSPADAWFETAPEGPGQRPAGEHWCCCCGCGCRWLQVHLAVVIRRKAALVPFNSELTA